MIAVDRDSPIPISDQLVEQVRYFLATGRYLPGDALPSTRQLAAQLGISFHTVRKAYQQLEAEGLLASQPGVGYVVSHPPERTLEDRMERGATIAADAVQRLIGLGFSEDEIQMLLDEQVTFRQVSTEPVKVLFAAPYRELAELGARHVTAATHVEVTPVTIAGLGGHPDADLILAPHASYQAAVKASGQADVIPLQIVPPAAALDEVVRLYPEQTLGLITAHGDAIGHLLKELRYLASFAGPALALEAGAERSRLEELAHDVDLLVYTPDARRVVRRLKPDRPTVEYAPTIAETSLAAITHALRR